MDAIVGIARKSELRSSDRKLRRAPPGGPLGDLRLKEANRTSKASREPQRRPACFAETMSYCYRFCCRCVASLCVFASLRFATASLHLLALLPRFFFAASLLRLVSFLPRFVLVATSIGSFCVVGTLRF